MLITKERLLRAREISTNLAQGINPISNQPIRDAEFLNDPKMIRYFSFISEVLTGEIEGKKKKQRNFYIEHEEIRVIRLPEDEINITAFVDAVNNSLHLGNRKPLTAAKMNSQLRSMGILKYEITDGKKETRVSEKGKKLGVSEVEVERGDRTYYRISYTEKGKKFLLDNLIEILNYQKEEMPIRL